MNFERSKLNYKCARMEHFYLIKFKFGTVISAIKVARSIHIYIKLGSY